jgi:hypothetical protein
LGEQSAARLEGDRYQHLYSWYELLRLLDEDSIFEYAYVEHPEAGAADDVTLHPPATSSHAARYVQIKWHVDQRDSYSFTNLTEVLSGARSLLQKLFDSWKELRKAGPVEVWLVSNWPSAQDLGGFLRSRGYTLSDDFFICTPRSAAAKARKAWMKQLGATDAEIVEFCRDLRLRLGFAGITDFEEMVDERMARYGLRRGENARAIAIDEVRVWVELGGDRKRITRDVLLEVIDRRDLRARNVEDPAVSLWIHGWGKRAFDREPTIELDWTQHFDRLTRRIPDQSTWESTLLPELDHARTKFSKESNGSYIDFRGKLPLTAVLAVGSSFSEVAGFKFRAEQPTRGENYLWKSDAKLSSRTFRVTEAGCEIGGPDILITLSITGDAAADVRPLAEHLQGRLKAIIYAEPDNGPGDGAITSNEDAVALAVRAKELIRTSRTKYRASQTHLVLYAPASFCLFLGQRLNALGKIVTYERTIEGGYQTSLTLSTG